VFLSCVKFDFANENYTPPVTIVKGQFSQEKVFYGILRYCE
jgi:hypothetical protein